MIVTLQFTMPEDHEACSVYMNAGILCNTLHEVQEECRRYLKHGFPDGMTMESLAQHIREMTAEALNRIDEP